MTTNSSELEPCVLGREEIPAMRELAAGEIETVAGGLIRYYQMRGWWWAVGDGVGPVKVAPIED